MSDREKDGQPPGGAGPQKKGMVYLVSGDIAEGKTHFTARLVHALQKQSVRVGGFYSPRVMDGDRTIGYDLVSLSNLERIPFLRESKHAADIGRFAAHGDAFNTVHTWVNSDVNSACKVMVIDEVGKWEMKGEGWSEVLSHLIQKEIAMIWVVRDSFVDDVIGYWNLLNTPVFNIEEADADHAAGEIIKDLLISSSFIG